MISNSFYHHLLFWFYLLQFPLNSNILCFCFVNFLFFLFLLFNYLTRCCVTNPCGSFFRLASKTVCFQEIFWKNFYYEHYHIVSAKIETIKYVCLFIFLTRCCGSFFSGCFQYRLLPSDFFERTITWFLLKLRPSSLSARLKRKILS